ncbi:hypothetical protein QR680_012483 [Steinernema hermaphroditum]|uniref:Uncharacterized protein n=1 Tax=Steinernema hermaphroditum TaxID=289476 RepID=A0AA39I265_9BILA|nr:hypothetical protein QR680_012483 [Steinernema hermaphroditum]
MEMKTKQPIYETIGKKPLAETTPKGRIGVLVVLGLVSAAIIFFASFLFYRFADNYSACIDLSDSVYMKVSDVLSEVEPINGHSYRIFLQGETQAQYVDRCLFWPNDTVCLHDLPPLKKDLDQSLEVFEFMEACVFSEFSKLIELGSELAVLRAKVAQLRNLRARCRPFYTRLNECGTGSYLDTAQKRRRSVREINEAMTWDVYYGTDGPRR